VVSVHVATSSRRGRGRILAGLTAALVAIPALGAAWLLRDPSPHFRERRSTLASVEERDSLVEGGSRFRTARLVATSGLAVTLTTRRQLSDTGRLPLVVILGGHVTGAEAAKLVGEAPGVVVAAVSYPFEGDPRPGKLTFLRQIPTIRRAFLATPPAQALALDYLLGLPGVDTTRVEAIGVSMGAPFVTIAGALDTRFTRVWAIHGSGGSYAPLESNMKRSIPNAPLRAVAAGISNVIISGPRLAPEQWAARIAPRPFMMVNASDDERMPRASVDALYEAAKEPKELIWMSGGHIHADQPTIQRLVTIVLTRVAEGPGPRVRTASVGAPPP
jgi:fermentation-respiration switch protein FrsA (DUF1100 family)